VPDPFPDVEVHLHLHDTHGMAVANGFTGLKCGVMSFASAVAGLRGCAFAGSAGAARNMCAEDPALLCKENGIDTGVELDRPIEAARLAERIIGRQLPGSVMYDDTLVPFQKRAA